MRAFALAHDYVTMDRWVFRQLKGPALDEICETVKKRLKDEGGHTALAALCQTPEVEEREILWILAGCEGLSGFGGRVRVESRNAKTKNQNRDRPRVSPTAQLFGRKPEQLSKNLKNIRETASIIESIQRSTFGPMAKFLISSTPYTLRSYASLIEAAQSDFGHGTEWFLNISKARLVIHVKHWTGDPHDKEVSSLIAAIIGNEDYGRENQKRWREKYNHLVSDRQLDPYTILTAAERAQRNQEVDELLKEPAVNDSVKMSIKDFLTILQSRFPSQK